MIDRFSGTGTIAEFSSEEKERERRTLIADSVGYGDGFNHIRAAHYLKRVIDGLPSAPAPHYTFSLRQLFFHTFTVLVGAFYVRSIYKHLHKFKKHLWVFENYKMKDIERLYARYSVFLDEFYTKHNIEERFRAGTLFVEVSSK